MTRRNQSLQKASGIRHVLCANKSRAGSVSLLSTGTRQREIR